MMREERALKGTKAPSMGQTSPNPRTDQGAQTTVEFYMGSLQ